MKQEIYEFQRRLDAEEDASPVFADPSTLTDTSQNADKHLSVHSKVLKTKKDRHFLWRLPGKLVNFRGDKQTGHDSVVLPQD